MTALAHQPTWYQVSDATAEIAGVAIVARWE